jgi:hypothetical protein
MKNLGTVLRKSKACTVARDVKPWRDGSLAGLMRAFGATERALSSFELYPVRSYGT